MFEELSMEGVFLIKSAIHKDERGSFARSFCSNEFLNNGLMSKIAQGNISKNHLAGTLRGFHCQKSPYQESKVITCINGSIHNVVIDLRQNSATFLQSLSFVLDHNSGTSAHIPAGCANAWLTLNDGTILHYYMSNFYNPDFAFGIRWNDPFFKINWPLNPTTISEKDQNYENFDVSKLIL
jgi:dTDP-4-dehydrorhamnose 3,5-epimerase